MYRASYQVKGALALALRLLLVALLAFSLVACQGDQEAAPQAKEETKEPLTPGTYTGVFVITASPLLEYGQKALDDPESVPEMTGENAEACEELDLNDEEIRAQIDEALNKGRETIGKEIPLTIVITEGDDGLLKATAKLDFAAAFPDEGCEPAVDEPYELTHEPGKIQLSASQVEEGETLATLFEGKILPNGILEGTFKMTSNNVDYVNYTKTEVMIEGTWKATKGQ